jgi:DNA-binding NarL/FixJ family response regulator
VSTAARVVIVEDHALVRAGLRTALTSAGFEVVGEAIDGPQGLALAKELRPDVLVLDIGLPGIDGIELTRMVQAELPQARVVILTMHDVDTEVLAALAAGADAYVLKSSDQSAVITAVGVAADGGAYFDPQIAHIVLQEFGTPRRANEVESPLSSRETEILRLIAEGNGNAEIAQRLYLSLGTVKGHIRDILDKLSASDRTHAAVTALRKGFI